MAFLEGYGVGFAMIVFIGPVFFTLLKSSLQFGFWGGMSVTFGILFSDVVCVALCSFGAIPFFRNPDNQFWLAIAGGAILIGLGIKYIIKPFLFSENTVVLQSRHYSTLFTKGFIVNFVNPFVFLVWIGVIGYGRTKFGFTADLAIFLSAALLAILTTDSLKVIFAHRIKSFIRPTILLNVYRVIGVLLIGFGVRMILLIA